MTCGSIIKVGFEHLTLPFTVAIISPVSANGWPKRLFQPKTIPGTREIFH